MNTVDIGRLGEKHAANFLKRNKFKILEKNIQHYLILKVVIV